MYKKSDSRPQLQLCDWHLCSQEFMMAQETSIFSPSYIYNTVIHWHKLHVETVFNINFIDKLIPSHALENRSHLTP